MFNGWLGHELQTTAGRVSASAMSSDVYDPSDGPTCCDGSSSGGASSFVTYSDVCVANARLRVMETFVGVTVFIQCIYSSCSQMCSVNAWLLVCITRHDDVYDVYSGGS